MANRFIDWVLRRQVVRPDIPECPDHHVQMRLRGSQGRPARFERQTDEEYTYIYFCPIEQCNQNALVKRPKSQAPVPEEYPGRPIYARRSD